MSRNVSLCFVAVLLAALAVVPATASASMTIPAGSSVTLSNLSLGACNSLSGYYQLDNGSDQSWGYFGGGCGRQYYSNVTIPAAASARQLRIVLYDNRCGYRLPSDGPHGYESGSGSTYSIGIGDGGGSCEKPPGSYGGGSNLTAYITIESPITISCGSADGAWHASDVSIACTASDSSGSGLADAGDAAFNLTTSVADGTQSSNAETGTNEVCNNAGACKTAGPVTGNKVDKKAPTVGCAEDETPEFLLNQAEALIVGTVSDGGGSGAVQSTVSAAGDTSSLGDKTVDVTGTDNVGNSATTACPYKVVETLTVHKGYKAVSAGESHTCAIKARDRSIVCWGYNGSGQTAAPTGAFKSVDAGASFNCAVRTDGTLACWGANGWGQINAPTGTFKSVSAGGEHACAVKTDDTVQCWGRYNESQIYPPGGVAFKSVSAGGNYTCGVKADDTVACWGYDYYNSYGQYYAPSGSFKSISAGTSHACGIKTDDNVQCWGRYYEGQVYPLSGAFKSVTVGSYYSCGVRADETLACWGSTPGTAPAGLFKAVSGGGSHACALATDDKLACWGSNGSGQATVPGPPVVCGSADGAWHADDVSIACTASDDDSGLADEDDAAFSLTTSVAAGTQTSTAATGTHQVCNNDGECSTAGPITGNKVDRKAPSVTCAEEETPEFLLNQAEALIAGTVSDGSGSGAAQATVSSAADTSSVGDKTVDVTGTDNVGNSATQACPYKVVETLTVHKGYRAVSAGSAHTCAIKARDRSLVCWGANFFGETNAPSGAFKSVDAGRMHTCALRTDATLACWGRNSWGQTSAPSGTFKSVSAGGEHSCAVGTDDSVQCWGRSNEGQIYAPGGSFKSVSAGGNYTCGVKADDTAACWGYDYYNSYGQYYPPSGSFKSISAGTMHTCGVKSDDAVSCWGRSYEGQIYPPSGSFKSVSVGGFYSCGVSVDDTLACWGQSLGTAPSDTFKSVSIGDSHACALTTGDRLACWGSNGNGQATPPGPPVVCGAADGDWHADDVSIACTASDSESGLANEDDAAFSLMTSVAAGTETANAATGTRQVCNNDGECSTAGPITDNKVDKKGPSVTCATNVPEFLLDQADANVTAAVADGGSGAAASTASAAADTSHLGPKTVELSATDNVGNETTKACPYRVVRTLSTGARFMAVSAGGSHTCALLVDGQVACWGNNDNQQSNAPTGTFTAVSAGGYHTCAIETDGDAICWGNNGSGQSDAPAGTFKSISAGQYHTCAVRTDDSVACWGSGQGYGEAYAPGGTFKSVSASTYHTCGIRTDDTVQCWGYGEFVNPPADTFTSIATGIYHSCGVTTAGAIACWGWTTGASPDLGTFKAVGSSDNYDCAVKDDDALTCWGSDSAALSAPTGSFKTLDGGQSHSCAITTADALACWGNNGNGQTTVPELVTPDTTSPTIGCADADSEWHADNVTLACTASDADSGILAEDEAFDLSTTVAAGSEDSDASTGSREVCDNAGNCVTAGPVSGNKVDRKGPALTCASAVPTFQLNQDPATVEATVADAGSGAAATLTSAAADTSTGGEKTVELSAVDNVGNSTTQPCPYVVEVPDTTAPTVDCDDTDADQAWRADNVTIVCTASDDGSGLADAADATFQLSTSVDDDTADGDASTGTHEVCDVAGNCVTAGPVEHIKVDRVDPVVTCEDAPEFTVGQDPALVQATVTDGDSGALASPVGSPADVSSGGSRTVEVIGWDNAGNNVTQACAYNVLEPTTTTADTPTVHATYGDATATLSAQVSGSPSGGTVQFRLTNGSGYTGEPVSGEVVDGVASVSYPIASLGAGTYTILADYGGVDGAFASSDNAGQDPVAQLVVDKAAQEITMTAPTGLVYAGPDVDFSASSDSGLPVTVISVSPSYCSIVAGKVHPIRGGTCWLRATQAGNANYEAAKVVRTSSPIAKLPLTQTASDASMVYGDPVPTITATYDGFVNGDDASDIDDERCFSPYEAEDGAHKSVTKCTGTSINYSITRVKGQLTVARRPATLTYTGDAASDATVDLKALVTPEPGGDVDLTLAKPVKFALKRGTTSYACTANEVTEDGDATCAITLPPGTYNVTVTMGAKSAFTAPAAHAQITVF